MFKIIERKSYAVLFMGRVETPQPEEVPERFRPVPPSAPSLVAVIALVLLAVSVVSAVLYGVYRFITHRAEYAVNR